MITVVEKNIQDGVCAFPFYYILTLTSESVFHVFVTVLTTIELNCGHVGNNEFTRTGTRIYVIRVRAILTYHQESKNRVNLNSAVVGRRSRRKRPVSFYSVLTSVGEAIEIISV